MERRNLLYRHATINTSAPTISHNSFQRCFLIKKFRRCSWFAGIFANMNHRSMGITPPGCNKSGSLHGPNEPPI